MFDAPTSTADLAVMVGALGRLAGDVEDAERIDRIRLLEELKGAVAAAQAAETARFVASQREQQAAVGVSAERVGRGIAAQVGLARRISHFHARRYAGWAEILTNELPHTFTELASGRVSEWRAMIVARETAWLSREHRALVDAELAPRLRGLGDRRVEAETKKAAYRLDPRGYLHRIRGAANDRMVSLRPAPDVMSRLSAFLPVAQGVATFAALSREADSLRAAGDGRSRGQIMADTLVERVTGQTIASDVPVEVDVVIKAESLVGGGDEPAEVLGYGPVPAAYARELIAERSDEAKTWVRRLFTRPNSSELAAMESRRREFTPAQRKFVMIRDLYCATPWCEAPIRHVDHVLPAKDDGTTVVDNGQGLCEACNYAKQAEGWAASSGSVRTPTGHVYGGNDPPMPDAA